MGNTTKARLILNLEFVDRLVGELISNEKKTEDILKILLSECLKFFGGELGYVSLFSKDSEQITALQKADVTGRFSNFSLPELTSDEKSSLSSWVVNNVKGYLYPSDLNEDKLYKPYKNLVNEIVRSELLAPLICEHKVIGLLVISSTKNLAFDKTDLSLLEKIAAKAGEMIQGSIFYDASKILFSESFENMDETQICNRIATIAKEILATTACSIWLIENDNEEEFLKLKGWNSLNNHSPQNFIIRKSNESLSWEVIEKARKNRKEAIEFFHNLSEPSSSFLHKSLASKLNLKSMASIPIIHHNEVIGVVNTYSSRKYEFLKSEKLLFEGIASRCASAIFVARLNKRNEELRDKWSLTNVIANPGIVALTFVHDITHQLHFFTEDLNLLDDFIPKNIKNYDVINSKLDSLNEHADSIQRSFLSLVRIGKSVKTGKKPFSIKTIIEDVEHLFKRRFEENRINFLYSMQEPNIRVNCRPNEIEQVFVNLLLNSISALKPATHRRKIITIKTERVIKENVPNLKISFYDNGTGIAKENLNLIYQPDFSTKGEDGSGFGLSICKRIIENHSGTLTHVSEFGEYTYFFIHLPIP